MSRYTVEEVIKRGETIRAYCHNSACHHNAVLDALAIRDRFGPDFEMTHDNLTPKLRCIRCGGRDVGIIRTPGTKEYGGNPYLKSRGG